MNYDEAEMKFAIIHKITKLTGKENTPTITMTITDYIDETEDIIIDKNGNEIEKFRVMSYLQKDGKKIENPDYDPVKVAQHDLPDYLQMKSKISEEE